MQSRAAVTRSADCMRADELTCLLSAPLAPLSQPPPSTHRSNSNSSHSSHSPISQHPPFKFPPLAALISHAAAAILFRHRRCALAAATTATAAARGSGAAGKRRRQTRSWKRRCSSFCLGPVDGAAISYGWTPMHIRIPVTEGATSDCFRLPRLVQRAVQGEIAAAFFLQHVTADRTAPGHVAASSPH